jgi:hypothetical protein
MSPRNSLVNILMCFSAACAYYLLYFQAKLVISISVLEFELRALCLLGRCSITSAIPPVKNDLVISEIGSYFLPRLANSWNDKCIPPHSAFSIEMGSHEYSTLPWSQTEILLISASQVARITSLSHHTGL